MPISVATTRVALRTTTGTQDITIPGFGTPKAALFLLNQATSDGVATDHDCLGIGLTDGVRQVVLSVTDKHNVASSATTRVLSTVACVQKMTTGLTTNEVRAVWSAWVTDGVQINVNVQTTATAYLLTVVLFGGSDLTAYVGTLTANSAQNGTVVTTAPGFLFDDLLLCSDGAASGSALSTLTASLGVCHHASGVFTQRALGVFHRTAISPSQVTARLDTTHGLHLRTSITAANAIEVTAGSATGFTLTTRLSTSSASVGYLALTYGGAAQSWVGTVATPTTTGALAYTGPGFQPQAVLLAQSLAPAVNADQTGVEGGTCAVSLLTSPAQYCLAQSSVDNVATTDTQSLHDDVALVVPQHDGSTGLAATLASLDATGWTLNYSAVLGTARQGWAWAIEGAPAGGETRNLTAALLSATTTPATVVTQAHALTAGLVSTTSTPLSDVILANLRSLTATLLMATTTPDSPVTQGRSLTAGLLHATSTPASVSTQARNLTAMLSPLTATPASAVLQARALTGGLLGETSTPAAAFTLAQLITLVAALENTTTTPAGSATQARNLAAVLSPATATPASGMTQARALTSTVLTATTTPPSSISMTGQIAFVALLTSTTTTPSSASIQACHLTAQILSATTTPSSPLTQARTLSVILLTASTTPASPSTQTRTLTGTLTATTATPDISIALAGLLQLQASLLSSTSTPASPATQVRTFVAAILTTTATPTSPLTLVRSLSAEPLGSTTTPSAPLPIVHRGLTASVSNTTSAPAVTVLVTGQVVFVANLLGHTVTATPTIQVSYALTAALQGTTTTPPASIALAGIRPLSAGLVSSTTIPDAAAVVHRPLTTALLGSTSTPSSPHVQQRVVTALLVSSTTTPAALPVTTLRAVLAHLPSDTTTPPVTPQSHRAFLATLLTATATPAINLGPLVRALTAAPLLSTLAPPVLAVEMVRGIMAALLTITISPSAPISVQGQVLFFAGLLIETSTLETHAMQRRALLAALEGMSSTLVAALEPGIWGEVLRPVALPGGGTVTHALHGPPVPVILTVHVPNSPGQEPVSPLRAVPATMTVSLRVPHAHGAGAITPILRPAKAA